MAYQFTNEIVAKIKVTDENGDDVTLNGINGREQNADSIMGGISALFGIVGWGTQGVVRIVNQDVEEVS